MAVDTCRKEGNENIILLKTSSQYPAKIEDANLKMIPDLAKRFQVLSGLSDHTSGELVPVTATALGAVVIEKHITLNKSLKDADHKISFEPQEFKTMVKKIRNIEKIFGSNKILPNIKEIKLRKKNHRYIISKTSLKKGEYISLNKILFKRMKKIKKKTLKPKDYFKISKKKLTRDLNKNTQISLDFFKK